MLQPFHLAIPVDDLEAARGFYGDLFGCEEGRSSDHWIDYNFFGHQLVVHMAPKGELAHNPVDGKSVPVPHFGVVLAWDDWHALADKLTKAGCEFVIEPEFDLKAFEAGHFLLFDPTNALEFKAQGRNQLFAT